MVDLASLQPLQGLLGLDHSPAGPLHGGFYSFLGGVSLR